MKNLLFLLFLLLLVSACKNDAMNVEPLLDPEIKELRLNDSIKVT